MKTLKKIATIIRSHHEEYNGSGFPDKLRNGHIPLGSQIIKIVSDYDDLKFKKGLSIDEAIKRIKEGSYKSYDPDIANTFIKIVSDSSTPQHSPITRVKVQDHRQALPMGQASQRTVGLERQQPQIPSTGEGEILPCQPHCGHWDLHHIGSCFAT